MHSPIDLDAAPRVNFLCLLKAEEKDSNHLHDQGGLDKTSLGVNSEDRGTPLLHNESTDISGRGHAFRA